MNIVASSPQGLEKTLSKEIHDLGGTNIKIFKRFISFNCDIETLYRIHFYSRIAFRFYREIARFPCLDKYSLYEGVQKSFDWLNWLSPDKSFYVQVTGKNPILRHSHFTALQVKNAIVDLQNKSFGDRSDISLDSPDLVIHLHLNSHEAIVSLQTTIESLHKRGYRPAMADAPLKENLAAGLIQITEWDGNKPLLDIMCGSGILMIEAISQYLRVPNLIKRNYLFENWADFNKDIFIKEKLKIKRRPIKNLKIPKVIGCEINTEIFMQAKKNILLAGVDQYIEIYNMDFANLKNNCEPGIILCNPPYGIRIGQESELVDLYSKLGIYLKENFSGWTFWLLSGNAKMTKYLKMKASLKFPISNGGIDCRWIKYVIR
tara:strand:- start:57 stop:1181 length:1125 start_codon:yes stop_codon:yes gene_type:complete